MDFLEGFYDDFFGVFGLQKNCDWWKYSGCKGVGIYGGKKIETSLRLTGGRAPFYQIKIRIEANTKIKFLIMDHKPIPIISFFSKRKYGENVVKLEDGLYALCKNPEWFAGFYEGVGVKKSVKFLSTSLTKMGSFNIGCANGVLEFELCFYGDPNKLKSKSSRGFLWLENMLILLGSIQK